MRATKQIEWDMGHRVLNHKSQCKNLHGHHYKLEISIEGQLVNTQGSSNEGMVIDFTDIKQIAMDKIHNVLDHGFVIWDKDTVLVEFYKNNPTLKHLIVPFTSTAENLAEWIFQTLDKEYGDLYGTGLNLYEVKLWETPTSVVTCNRNDMENKLND